MVTISLCMIVKNEEAILSRCLKSVTSAVDEIIIVDTGSSDNTKAIAAEFTDKIYNFEWIDDFSAARNFAYSKATMDYQMWLDADDVLPPESCKKLLELKGNLPPTVDIVTMKYNTHFDEYGVPVFTSTRERLTRRERGYRWQDPVHECIPLVGNIVHTDIVIHHRKPQNSIQKPSNRNLEIYNNLERRTKILTPRQQYYFARELKDHKNWHKSAYYFEKFLNSGKGWIEDNISACFNLAICYNSLGDNDKALSTLRESFAFDSPRAEICSEIGYHYKRDHNFQVALRWFKIAASLDLPDSKGFILPDYYGYIPNIEACVCCCELGEFKIAETYNERAAIYKPNSPAVKNNRVILARLNIIDSDEVDSDSSGNTMV
ncbi:MAG: glycosyltransferase family 2 protein [Oscillospiraceae bacterium]|nr:glycosyltransferase family 2 protein [Oscillospiraceae bacterium]